MSLRPIANWKNRHARQSATALSRPVQKAVTLGKRLRVRSKQDQGPFVPPEDWHEMTEREGYRIIEQPPGHDFQHVVTAREVHQRLAQLPPSFVESLEVVQLSRMTRKKRSFPCYGMQWGNAIYLYPIEKGLVEHFTRPPRPAEHNEMRAYGARWVQESPAHWKLVWTPTAIRDFYLNNVLIHELGHLLDHRNGSYRDRERFAEWFAIEHGYRPTHQLRVAQRSKPRRRHARK